MLFLCCKREIEVKAKGLCGACYQRFRKTGSTEYQRKGKINYCHIKDCGGKVVSKGLCDKHRIRLKAHGHTGSTIPEIWGAKEKHPMYSVWIHLRKKKGSSLVSKLWVDDFFQFVLDVGERPSENHKFFRFDNKKPYSKDNFVWKETLIIKKEDESNQDFDVLGNELQNKGKACGVQ